MIKGVKAVCAREAIGRGELMGYVRASCRGGMATTFPMIRMGSSARCAFLRLDPLQEDAPARTDACSDPEYGELVAIDEIVDTPAIFSVAEQEQCDFVGAVEHVACDFR
jgi:hypothetical protein